MEFNLRYKGALDAQRERWEIARWIVFHEYLGNPYIKSHNKPKCPADVLRFADEPEAYNHILPETCHVSAEEQRVLEEIMTNFRDRQKS